jgi:hypothetical protein
LERQFNTLQSLIGEDKNHTKSHARQLKELHDKEVKEVEHQEKTGEVGEVTKGA